MYSRKGCNGTVTHGTDERKKRLIGAASLHKNCPRDILQMFIFCLWTNIIMAKFLNTKVSPLNFFGIKMIKGKKNVKLEILEPQKMWVSYLNAKTKTN